MFENIAYHILLPFDILIELGIVEMKCELDDTANLNNIKIDEGNLEGVEFRGKERKKNGTPIGGNEAPGTKSPQSAEGQSAGCPRLS